VGEDGDTFSGDHGCGVHVARHPLSARQTRVRAVEHYFVDQQDHVSAITLAHAAAELLADWYAAKVAHDPVTRATALRKKYRRDEPGWAARARCRTRRKEEGSPLINRAANALKHGGGDAEARAEIDWAAP
jgi:hypothetical protein